MIDVYHNILWSRYKAAVFASLSRKAAHAGVPVAICQIAETEVDRVALSAVDYSVHAYPFRLLFNGSYESVGVFRLASKLFWEVLRSRSKLVILPGYHRIEYWGMLFACLMRGKKVGVFCDSTMLDRPQSPIKGIAKRCIFRLVDGIFVYGQRAKDYVVHYGAKPAKVFVRCQAAALPAGYSEDAVRVRRHELRSNASAPQFLYVGRLSREKSLDDLLMAFANADLGHGAQLLMVGAGPDRERLESIVVQARIAGVKFCGPRNADELPEFYMAATCLVLPSKSEPWGLVVNEALSHGCPVIVSSACGCVPELASDAAFSINYPVGDIASLTQALRSAPVQFADETAVTEAALSVMREFTPDKAASSILEGAISMVNGSRSSL